MPGRARSVIEVAILADVKNLDKTLTAVDTKIGTIGKVGAGVVGGFVALGVIDKGFEFVAGALDKADAFSDAFADLAGTITPQFADDLKDVAFDFTNIGLSADEVGVLAAHFANLATAAGVTAPAIATMTPDLLKVAAAIAATTGKTVDEVVDAIGKAAAGNERPIRDLGIDLDAIAEGLSPDETLRQILDDLITKFPELTSQTQGVADKQDVLNAKWDNFSTKVGQALEGPLAGVLDFFTTMIDRDIPHSITDLQNLGKAFEDFGRIALAPLGNVRDALGGIGDAINNLNKGLGAVGNFIGGTGSREQEIINAERRYKERNGLTN